MSTLPHTTSRSVDVANDDATIEDARLQLTWTLRRRPAGSEGVVVDTVTVDIHVDRLVLTTVAVDGSRSHETIPAVLERHERIDSGAATAAGTDAPTPAPLTIDVWTSDPTARHRPFIRLHRTSDLDWIVRSDIPAHLGMPGGTYRLDAVRDLLAESGTARRT